MIKVAKVHDLGIEQIERIAFDGEQLTLDGSLLASIASRRAELLDALEETHVYGVNTGMGYLASIELTDAQTAQHQRNMLLGRAVGSAPWLSRSESRAVVALRLINFLSGHAGVTPELCSFIVDRLNDDFVPAIPRRAVGSSGEVMPLAHAFQTLTGVGSVLDAYGVAHPAAEALAGRAVLPFAPQAKEGVALLAGAPATAALGLARGRSAARLVDGALVCWATAIDALQAPPGPYSAAVAHLEDDDLLSSILKRLGDLLSNSTRASPQLQAPVSFRVIPQVLTHAERSLGRLAADVRRAAAAVTDSPAFVDGGFVGNGSFHRVEVAAGMDSLSAALVRVAELSAQHLHRLLDHRFTGLPDQLTPVPGPRCGLVVVQKRAAGVVNELRRLAAPASVGLADTSLGHEDAQTYSFEAAENLRRAEALTREVLACELLAVRQAWALRGRDPAPGLVHVAELIGERVAPVDDDRPLGGDIDLLVELLANDRLGAVPGAPGGQPPGAVGAERG